MMRDLRDRLAVQVARTAQAPAHRARHVIGRVLLVIGFGVAAGWFTFGVIKLGPSAWIYPVVWAPYVGGIVVAIAGQSILGLRELAITAWNEARFTEYAVDKDILRTP